MSKLCHRVWGSSENGCSSSSGVSWAERVNDRKSQERSKPCQTLATAKISNRPMLAEWFKPENHSVQQHSNVEKPAHNPDSSNGLSDRGRNRLTNPEEQVRCADKTIIIQHNKQHTRSNSRYFTRAARRRRGLNTWGGGGWLDTGETHEGD